MRVLLCKDYRHLTGFIPFPTTLVTLSIMAFLELYQSSCDFQVCFCISFLCIYKVAWILSHKDQNLGTQV